jgi:NitT/TauT family transport system substrate-binding protein
MQQKFKTQSRLHITLTVLVLGILAFGSESAGQQLNYRLKWLFNASVVGDLYAYEQGFFKKAGLDVTVKSGGPERDAIRELELGYAQFGVASADQVIKAAAKGAPVKVVAQLFQINPLQWLYRSTDMQIKRLQDLRGKTIGITYGGNDETIMRTLLTRAGLKDSDVAIFSVRYDYTPFYQGRADLWPVYRNSQGIIISEKLATAGESVGFLNPAEFGVNFVANSVVTSERLLKESPQTVQRFTKALLAGWQAALANRNRRQAIDLIRQYDKDSTAQQVAKQYDVTRGLVYPDAQTPIGTIDKDAWKQTEAIMLAQKLIKEPIEVEAFLVFFEN